MLACSIKNMGVACIFFPQSVIEGKESAAKYMFFIYKVCIIIAISDFIQNEILNWT